ncbi:MAG: hypothetical protein ACM3NH_00050 [Candidatus Saccharibacteria bacterium]
MRIRPTVLMFSGEEVVGKAVAATRADEYRPDVSEVRQVPIRPRQKLEVTGLSNDSRFLVRLPSAPLPVLVHPKNIRINRPDAEGIIRRYAGILNQDPTKYLGYRR